MLRPALRATALGVLLLAVIWAVPSFAISKEFNQSYPLQPGGSLELQNVNGTVDVQGWDRNEIEVHAVKTAKHKESDLERVSIEVDAKPDAVSIATHYPQNEGVEVAVEYTIHVPRGARVEHIGTVNGTLRVAGVETVEDLHTVNGNIEVFEAGGSVHAHTTNGNVHLELAHLQDKTGAGAETTNGSLVLAVPSDLQADVEARCLNGNFFSERPTKIEVLPGIETDDLNIVIGDDGSSWLGVETHEVTADKAKELKLSAERGVFLGKIVPDSPAAKAGLKENDVVTEINGQRVEGAAQFRRMIHEIPAGRSIQLTVWRDGRTQTVNATLGKSEERRHAMKMVAPTPGTFSFRMPEMPEIPSMEWNGGMLFGVQPRLGIDAEEISGQLGAFFGAPDGEGILVRDVNSGSPAEKAGVKAGDVITSLNGERIHSVGELREKLSAKRDDKERTVKLGVLRNKSEISLTVELPAPAARTKRLVSRRTSI